MNAFCQQLPFFGNSDKRNKDSNNYKTAYDLMQLLCLHQNKQKNGNQYHLKQVLSMVKDQNGNHNARGSTNPKNNRISKQNDEKRKKREKQQQRQKRKIKSQLEKKRLEMEYYDQQWIVMVSGITILSILLFGMGKK